MLHEEEGTLPNFIHTCAHTLSLSLSFSVSLSLCISLCLSVSMCVHVYLSISLSVFLALSYTYTSPTMRLTQPNPLVSQVTQTPVPPHASCRPPLECPPPQGHDNTEGEEARKSRGQMVPESLSPDTSGCGPLIKARREKRSWSAEAKSRSGVWGIRVRM